MRIITALAFLFTTQAHAVLNCVNIDDNGVYTSTSWLVGQPSPSLNVTGEVACAANGQELAYITQRFTGLRLRPITTKTTVLWRGDDAEFILDNL